MELKEWRRPRRHGPHAEPGRSSSGERRHPGGIVRHPAERV